MMDKIAFRKTLVRFGKIVEDHSWDNDKGSYRETIFYYMGYKYRVRMHNGEVLTVGEIK